MQYPIFIYLIGDGKEVRRKPLSALNAEPPWKATWTYGTYVDAFAHFVRIAGLSLTAREMIDVSETNQDLHKLDRDGLIDLIGKRITQAIVLLNHLKGGRQPFESYVAEKLSTYPVLDRSNGDVFESIATVLEACYGIDIRPSWAK